MKRRRNKVFEWLTDWFEGERERRERRKKNCSFVIERKWTLGKKKYICDIVTHDDDDKGVGAN